MLLAGRRVGLFVREVASLNTVICANMMIKRVGVQRLIKCLSRQPKDYRIFTVSMALACGGGRHKGRIGEKQEARGTFCPSKYHVESRVVRVSRCFGVSET